MPVSFKETDIRFIDQEFHSKINEAFSNHPILRLEKDLELTREVWDTLPSLHGANLGLVADKDAYVLAELENASYSSVPALVVGEFGEEERLCWRLTLFGVGIFAKRAAVDIFIDSGTI